MPNDRWTASKSRDRRRSASRDGGRRERERSAGRKDVRRRSEERRHTKRERSRSRDRHRGGRHSPSRDEKRRREDGKDREKRGRSKERREEKDKKGKSRSREREEKDKKHRSKSRERKDKKHHKHDKDDRRKSDDKGKERGSSDGGSRVTKDEASKDQGAEGGKSKKDKEEDEEEEEDMVYLLGEEDEEREIEERKRRRQEILDKHRKQAEQERKEMSAFANNKDLGAEEDKEIEQRRKERAKLMETGGTTSPQSSSSGESPKRNGKGVRAQDAGGEDDDDEEEAGDVQFTWNDKSQPGDEGMDENLAANGGMTDKIKEVNKHTEVADNKNDGLLDMFSFSPSAPTKLHGQPGRVAVPAALKLNITTEDTLEGNWDDAEGYYKPLIGELLQDRYFVQGDIGRGVFSTVLRCQDTKEQKLVAIKVVRNNDHMRKAAQKELEILREISAADVDNKKHCVQLLDHFDHRNHISLVFENMPMNLRETLSKFGRHVGINIAGVRTYAKQLLIALKHIGSLGIVHADIKPDNILVGEGNRQLKLCDFGSAFREDAPDNDPTPYLVSRFYRAPEITLGFEYNRAVDIWSIGCCLFELFTGHIAFAGRHNNDMIRLIMEYKGPVSNRLIRKHIQAYQKFEKEPMFDSEYRFRQQEVDSVTGAPTFRMVHISKPTKDLTATLIKAKAPKDDKGMVTRLGDLLEKIFTIDPTKRITVKDALQHPFVRDK